MAREGRTSIEASPVGRAEVHAGGGGPSGSNFPDFGPPFGGPFGPGGFPGRGRGRGRGGPEDEGPQGGFEPTSGEGPDDGSAGPWGPGGPRGRRGGPGPFGGRGPGGRGRGGRGQGPGGRGQGRRSRGDVRLAILALLRDEPRHGYQIIQEISERSGGSWKPSPGSVYPTVAQLADEGLVHTEKESGRTVVHLTEAGRSWAEEHAAELDAVWSQVEAGADDGFADLRTAGRGLAGAVAQIAQVGTSDQIRQATSVLDEARRRLYLLLAEVVPRPRADSDTNSDTEPETTGPTGRSPRRRDRQPRRHTAQPPRHRTSHALLRSPPPDGRNRSGLERSAACWVDVRDGERHRPRAGGASGGRRAWTLQSRTIHGYRRAFRMAGSGPVLLLIHGIGDDSSTWDPVLDDLARDHTVLAPDLLGHGGSDKPRGDYSIGAYANGMRDLLSVLDIDRVTLVGTPWAAGSRCSSPTSTPSAPSGSVLIGAGGVAQSVTPALRAASLPLADLVLPMLRWPGSGSRPSWSCGCSRRSTPGWDATPRTSSAWSTRSPTPPAARRSCGPCARSSTGVGRS